MALTLFSDLSPGDVSLLRDVWKQWGMDLQIAVFEEELSELGEEITLAHMGGAHWSDGVFEELADVLICAQQIEVHLREFPDNLEGTHTLWMEVEEHAASTEVDGISPDNLLLIHLLKMTRAFARTRRFNNGNLSWNFDIISELGALVAVLLRTEQYLKGVSPFCPHWHRVQAIRAAKMDRLRRRLAEDQEAV